MWEYDQTLSIIQRDIELLKVNAFPNPSADVMQFELNNLPEGTNLGDFKLNVFDISGKMLQNLTFNSNELSISKEQCGLGLKVYHLTYEHKTVRTGQIIFN